MTYKSVFILGRQPAIGRAELESVLGRDHVQAVQSYAVASDAAPETVAFSRLGSAVKLGAVLGEVPASSWQSVQRELLSWALACAKKLSEGKIQLGISVYGFRSSPAQLTATGLTLKKQLRQAGYSVRLAPNQEPQLSSAQVLHNRLTGERGLELLVLRDGERVIVARTTAVQDITAYAQRDRGRPKRDAFVGMLPPKLAQTIINLAVGQARPHHDEIVLDPFCGTGVILQEATLMGFGAYGSDLDPRMVAYTDKNLLWLLDQPSCPVAPPANAARNPDWRYFRLETGDATSHAWQPVPRFVASETYLGRPLSSWPAPQKLHELIGTCNVIIEKFLGNLGGQLASGARLCLAVPAWRAPSGRLHHLPVLDRLGELGYNRVSFAGARAEELVYFRPDQIVARELLVITRK